MKNYESKKEINHFICTSLVFNETVSESTANACGVWGAVAVNTPAKAQVSVYNALGQIVKQQQVNAGITQISVPKGLYFET